MQLSFFAVQQPDGRQQLLTFSATDRRPVPTEFQRQDGEDKFSREVRRVMIHAMLLSLGYNIDEMKGATNFQYYASQARKNHTSLPGIDGTIVMVTREHTDPEIQDLLAAHKKAKAEEGIVMAAAAPAAPPSALPTASVLPTAQGGGPAAPAAYPAAPGGPTDEPAAPPLLLSVAPAAATPPPADGLTVPADTLPLVIERP